VSEGCERKMLYVSFPVTWSSQYISGLKIQFRKSRKMNGSPTAYRKAIFL